MEPRARHLDSSLLRTLFVRGGNGAFRLAIGGEIIFIKKIVAPRYYNGCLSIVILLYRVDSFASI